jgi:hypothetical protein
MGSSPTLDHQRIRWALDDDDDGQAWDRAGVSSHLAAHHPQVTHWPDDNPYTAHDTDHAEWIYDHPHPARDRQARQEADQAFTQLNPHVGIPARSEDVVARVQVQALEDQGARSPRVRFAELLENDQPTDAARCQVISRRAELAQQRCHQRARQRAAEAAFDRLNPDFGVPADHSDPAGQRVTREREAGLALGTRVAVAASRENDPTPFLTIAGQDYRAADAARTARLQAARARHDPARAGAER